MTHGFARPLIMVALLIGAILLTAFLVSSKINFSPFSKAAPNSIPGLIASFAFDDPDGQVLTRTNSLGAQTKPSALATGTIVASGKISLDGIVSKARKFSGANEIIDTKDSFLYNQGGFTIAMWYKPDSLQGSLFDNEYACRKWPAIQATLNDFKIWNSPKKDSFTLLSYDPPEIGTWTHLAFSYDGKNMQVYKNGVLAAGPLPAAPPWKTTSPLKIGGIDGIQYLYQQQKCDPANTYMIYGSLNGTLDEFQIYNRALNPGEIQELQQFEFKTPITPPPPPPIIPPIVIPPIVLPPLPPIFPPPPPDSTSIKVDSLFVSPSGNDNNPGTENSPFKTIVKAQSVVRQINKQMKKDITVYLREGTYTLTSPLTFDPNDSGMNGFNIIYQNYANETPIISGGKSITGWTADGNIWRAKVGTDLKTRQLYVNGVRATRARSNSPLPGAIKTATGYTTSDLSMQNWKNISDVELVTFNPEGSRGGSIWLEWRCGISEINENNITVKQPCFTNATGWKPINSSLNLPQKVENAYELLDSPGEWYLDQTNGILSYIPRPGEDMQTAQVIVPVVENLVSGSGTTDQKLQNIKFKGLTFAYNTWLEPSTNRGYPAQQGARYVWTVDSTTQRYTQTRITPAAITMLNSQNIVFDEDLFIHLGSSGINFDLGAKSNKVSNSTFTDISATAITLDGPLSPSVDSRLISSGNQFTNNLIHDVAVEYQGNEAIYIGWAQNTLIAHNEIFNVPYTAIEMSSRTGNWPVTIIPTTAHNNKVQNNLIHDYLKVLGDGGGIYTNGSQPGTIISGNVILTQFHSYAGIYLDGGSQYIEVANNILLTKHPSSPSIFVHRSGDHNIHDNWIDSWIGTNLENAPATFPYGISAEKNNVVISNISKAPATIISNAGRTSTSQ